MLSSAQRRHGPNQGQWRCIPDEDVRGSMNGVESQCKIKRTVG
jgi:hypothetical protein